VFSRYLRKLPVLNIPGSVSHLLNCLVGFKVNPCPQPQLSDEDESSKSSPEWSKLNANRMREEITKEVFKRYRYQLEDDWWNTCRHIVLLREVCLKMGFQMKARDYIFEKSEIVVNGNGKPKKATNGTNGHKAEETTFYPEDLLNVVPVVKDAPLKVLSN
jgi:protein TIF31